jgi:hypothetical protein
MRAINPSFAVPSFLCSCLNVSVFHFFVLFLLISLIRVHDSSLVVGLLMFAMFVFVLLLCELTFEVFVFECVTTQRREDEREGQNTVL